MKKAYLPYRKIDWHTYKTKTDRLRDIHKIYSDKHSYKRTDIKVDLYSRRQGQTDNEHKDRQKERYV